MEQGELENLGAGEQVVPASEAKQLRTRVRELVEPFDLTNA